MSADLIGARQSKRTIIFLSKPRIVWNSNFIGLAAVRCVRASQQCIGIQCRRRCRSFHKNINVYVCRQLHLGVSTIHLHIILSRIRNAVVNRPLIIRNANLTSEGIAIIISSGESI